MIYPFIHWITSNRINSLFIPALLGMFCFISCSSNKTNEDKPEKFPVTYPLLKDTVYSNEYVADIHSLQNVEIRARVSGFIETIHIDEGEEVKAGQLLFSISSQQYKQELLKAKAALASAIADAKAGEVDLNNTKMLVNKNVVSKSELDLATAKQEALLAKIEEAKALETSAELQVSFAQVRAPFSGVINRIPNKVGSLIEDGALLTTLSDNTQVFAYFNVSEKEYLDFASGKEEQKNSEVVLILANGTPHSSKGNIETVEGEIDKSTGNIAFRARFPNPDLLLKHGSTGKVGLMHSVKNALLVPQKSTFEIQDITYVYVLDEKNVARLRSIKPKFRIPHFYIVESGVTNKERILFEGIQQVKEGDQIDPQPIEIQNIITQLDGL